MDQKKYHKPVFIASCPNAEKDDRRIAFKTILTPWTWRHHSAKTELASVLKVFAIMHHVPAAYGFDTGRAALYAILKAADIGEDDEVILQAYTCLAVPMAIMWTKATPHYVDIAKGSYNTNAEIVKSAITENTRAVIIQHTFGEIAAIDEIRTMIDHINEKRTDDNKIILIEDCAHSLGGKWKGRRIGEWGDAAFFSFGQEKILSCTEGGMAISRNPDTNTKLSSLYKTAREMHRSRIFRLLLHPIVWATINSTYYFPSFSKVTVGRILLWICKRIRLLRHQAQPSARDLRRPRMQKMSNAQAKMLQNQLGKLPSYNRHRLQIASIYNRMLPRRHYIFPSHHVFLRFPLQITQFTLLDQYLKKNRVIPGNWYRTPVHPAEDISVYEYTLGSCPNAERACQQSINLPTGINVSTEDAKQVGELTVEFLRNQ